MARRGRPPHPDVLTPREREVLALLREGLSNEAIAQRLGVTLAGAKYHVSEILGKLGVSTREEAARWREGERPWWASALAPLSFLWRRTNAGWLSRATAGALAVGVAAGVSLLAWGLVRTEGGSGAGTPRGIFAPTADASQTPFTTATATVPLETGPPFDVRGPLSHDEALASENLESSLFIIDVPTREFFVVKLDQRRLGEDERLASALWFDENSLLLDFTSQAYRALLNGQVVAIDPVPAPTPTPQEVFASAHGLWQAVLEADGLYSGLLVGRSGEEPAYRLANTESPSWSRTGRLAFIGSICAGFDLFVFDPATAELKNLTRSLPAVWEFSWKADGSAMAASLIETRQLASIDAATGTHEILAQGPEFGSLVPLQWSPTGDRLLFWYVGGRGACESAFLPGAPTPENTSLSILPN